MEQTTNYQLKKPELTDAPPDITALNSNWDTIDTKLKALEQQDTNQATHNNDQEKHIGEGERAAWNNKAGKDHKHSASDITNGVLAIERGGTNSNNAADARINLGVAPSGYGLGEDLYDNVITNPLNRSLVTGRYGLSSDISGTTNLPETPFVGFADVTNYNYQWQYVVVTNMITNNRYYNIYQNSSWTGWHLVGEFPLQSSGRNFRALPYVRADGVMSIGRYVDFYSAETDESPNYSIRLEAKPGGEFHISNQTGASIRYYVSGSYTSWSPQSGQSAITQLGTSSVPWRCLYAQNGTVQTSDRNAKKNIEYDLEKYEDIFTALKPTQFKFNNDEDNKYHLGFIAQDIEKSLLDANLTLNDFGGIVKDDDKYSLNYSEIIALNTHMLQKAYKRIAELEAKISSLSQNKS